MELQQVPAHFIDRAWKDGASILADACDTSGGEITGDQLKMMLSRGERTLIRMVDDGNTVGWGVVRVDQLPNLRALHITDLSASNGHFEQFFTAIKDMASALGCSRVRCAAKPAQERLYRMKCGFKPVYQILEIEV
jgi:hypothetical protein